MTEIEAGRDFDILVAEKVMGYQVWQGVTGILSAFPPRDRNKPWFVLPHYSTDIAAAFQVVEKILDQLPGFECGAIYLPFRWRAEFAQGRYVAEASTLAEAICRAALAAVDAPVTV